MSRTYFGVGRFATSRDGNVDEAREIERARKPLPDIHAPEYRDKFGEFLDARSPTSHQAVGFEAGEQIWFSDPSGARRPAVVLDETRDQHSGKVEVTLAADDPHGSGTYRTSFEGDTARSMIQTDTRRIHE